MNVIISKSNFYHSVDGAASFCVGDCYTALYYTVQDVGLIPLHTPDRNHGTTNMTISNQTNRQWMVHPSVITIILAWLFIKIIIIFRWAIIWCDYWFFFAKIELITSLSIKFATVYADDNAHFKCPLLHRTIDLRAPYTIIHRYLN